MNTEPGYHGHGPVFRDTANRIGARLGLPAVRTCKRRGADKHLSSCSYWPHVVRPDGFYLGAYEGGDDDDEPPGRERAVSHLVVTLDGDPGQVADALIDALHKTPDETQCAVIDAVLECYGPEEWHEWLEQREVTASGDVREETA